MVESRKITKFQYIFNYYNSIVILIYNVVSYREHTANLLMC